MDRKNGIQSSALECGFSDIIHQVMTISFSFLRTINLEFLNKPPEPNYCKSDPGSSHHGCSAQLFLGSPVFLTPSPTFWSFLARLLSFFHPPAKNVVFRQLSSHVRVEHTAGTTFRALWKRSSLSFLALHKRFFKGYNSF